MVLKKQSEVGWIVVTDVCIRMFSDPNEQQSNYRKGSYGSEKTRINVISLPGITDYVCSSHVDRLPAVVINSWKCKFLARDESQPRVHSIMLSPRSSETKSLAEEFCFENHSFFTNTTLHIAPSSNSGFQNNKEFQKLISKIKRRKCM